jgi:hypothetical protein
MAAVTIARRLKRLDVPACRFRASDEVAIHVSARLGVELPGCPVVGLLRHEFRHVFVERKMLSNHDFKSILRATNEDAGGRAVP